MTLSRSLSTSGCALIGNDCNGGWCANDLLFKQLVQAAIGRKGAVGGVPVDELKFALGGRQER